MKFLILVILAACVISTQAACATTTSSVTGHIQCSAGDTCENTNTDAYLCGDASTTCHGTSGSKTCTTDPVLDETCSTAAGSLPCYSKASDFEQVTCIGTKCTAVYNKKGAETCSAGTECISKSCGNDNKCTVTAAQGNCTPGNNRCVGGTFCQYKTATSTTTCEAIIASGGDCFGTSDTCAPGQTCTAITKVGTNTAGKCVDYWSVAKGEQCSAGWQCKDGLTCDAVTTSTTYQTCIEPVTASGDCSLTKSCGNANMNCNYDTCECEANKEESSSDVSSAIKSLGDCLDADNCKGYNANAANCGNKCQSDAQSVAEAVGVNTITYRGWTLGEGIELCDSATALSGSFLLVAAAALFSL